MLAAIGDSNGPGIFLLWFSFRIVVQVQSFRPSLVILPWLDHSSPNALLFSESHLQDFDVNYFYSSLGFAAWALHFILQKESWAMHCPIFLVISAKSNYSRMVVQRCCYPPLVEPHQIAANLYSSLPNPSIAALTSSFDYSIHHPAWDQSQSSFSHLFTSMIMDSKAACYTIWKRHGQVAIIDLPGFAQIWAPSLWFWTTN